ncbi:MAG: hypothetical protein F6K42_18090 [Leptolyngbya sp. SIO1D8]|nr:hypothetical protein [Leptolyngbya sp. SIO1D8]
MGKSKTSKLHGKLALATPVAERLHWEIQYLNLSSRVFKPEEGLEIKSAAGLIRWAVQLFVDYCDVEYSNFIPLEVLETQSFSFYMSKMGLWDYAIKNHYGDSYSDLATQALYWYFDRIDSMLESDRCIYEQIANMTSDDLMRLFRAGGLDAISAT